MPSLEFWQAMLFNSMSVFRTCACVEFGAVFYSLGAAKGVSGVLLSGKGKVTSELRGHGCFLAVLGDGY